MKMNAHLYHRLFLHKNRPFLFQLLGIRVYEYLHSTAYKQNTRVRDFYTFLGVKLKRGLCVH